MNNINKNNTLMICGTVALVSIILSTSHCFIERSKISERQEDVCNRMANNFRYSQCGSDDHQRCDDPHEEEFKKEVLEKSFIILGDCLEEATKIQLESKKNEHQE